MAGQGPEGDSVDYALTNKRRVVQFVQEWWRTIGTAFWEDRTIGGFLEVPKIYSLTKWYLVIFQNFMNLTFFSGATQCSY